MIMLSACANTAPDNQGAAQTMPAPTATAVPTKTPVPTPAFDAANYGSEDLDVTYCTPQADKPHKLDIYYPQEGGPWPVILYVHGGGWSEGDKAEGAGWRGLNDQGYLVVSVNYRMAAEAKFPVMIEDVKCAVRYLRANSAVYNLDPDHIAAIGASAGGHLVALLGTADETASWDNGEYAEQSSKVQAVVPMAGIFDFVNELPNGLNSAVHYAFGKLGGTRTPEMESASPVSHISADDPPFLILHGDNDGVVPVAQSENFHAQLTAAGVPSTLIIVQGGDHGLQGPQITPTQEEIFAAINMFLETNLK